MSKRKQEEKIIGIKKSKHKRYDKMVNLNPNLTSTLSIICQMHRLNKRDFYNG